LATTIKDVAIKAGVSPATVSRVVGNYGYVSDQTRNIVLAAIKELGYHPNAIARSMVTKSTGTIGLVVTDITNPFFAQLARKVEEVTWKDGYTLILANTDEDLEHEYAVVRVMQEKRVDGLIVIPASSTPAPHLKELTDQGIALVLADRKNHACQVDVVMVDNEDGAYKAVSHLTSLGYQRIGMVLDNPEISTNVERMVGYRKALIDVGLKIDEELIKSCQYTKQSAYKLVCKLLSNPSPPDALFTANNFMTIGAFKAIRELGLKIPDDIALVGFDDLDWDGLHDTILTAVSQPVHDIGKLAAQRLLARIAGDDSPAQEIRLKTQFVIRRSCGAVLNSLDHHT